ncbi:hypothetical protein QNN00_12915 [Bacillus velezensis]|nr:hypothetical protein [Bacillus velezensis]
MRGVIGIAADHQTGNLAVELSRYFPSLKSLTRITGNIRGRGLIWRSD